MTKTQEVSFFWVPILPAFETALDACSPREKTNLRKTWSKVFFFEIQTSIRQKHGVGSMKRNIWPLPQLLILRAFQGVLKGSNPNIRLQQNFEKCWVNFKLREHKKITCKVWKETTTLLHWFPISQAFEWPHINTFETNSRKTNLKKKMQSNNFSKSKLHCKNFQAGDIKNHIARFSTAFLLFKTFTGEVDGCNSTKSLLRRRQFLRGRKKIPMNQEFQPRQKFPLKSMECGFISSPNTLKTLCLWRNPKTMTTSIR